MRFRRGKSGRYSPTPLSQASVNAEIESMEHDASRRETEGAKGRNIRSDIRGALEAGNYKSAKLERDDQYWTIVEEDETEGGYDVKYGREALPPFDSAHFDTLDDAVGSLSADERDSVEWKPSEQDE